MGDVMEGWDRRYFLSLIVSIIFSIAIPIKKSFAEVKKLLKNEDRPDFNVRWYKSFPPVDKSKWRLMVSGLCETPKSFTIEELRTLPSIKKVTRMKCVECWSSKAKWEGFSPAELFKIVRPKPEAKWLYFQCADDYFETISIEEIIRPNVMFVYGMNDKIIPDEYGAPLRLLVPYKYGYKSPKAITKIEFVKAQKSGTWTQYGYSSEGNIEAGWDHPQDLGGQKKIEGGELKY